MFMMNEMNNNIYTNIINYLYKITYKSIEHMDYFAKAKEAEAALDYDLAHEMYEHVAEQEHFNDKMNYEINIMHNWIVASGGFLNDKIQIKYYDVDYRGMQVNEKIVTNEPLVAVPRECILSLFDVQDEISRKYNVSTSHNSHTILALKLIEIKYDQRDPKHRIVRCLPKFFSNVPIFYTDEFDRLMTGSMLQIKMYIKLHQLLSDYNYLRGRSDEVTFSVADYIWARTCIITRVYAVTRNGKKDTFLVPLADMANHSCTPNTEWHYDEAKDQFVVSAKQPIYVGNVVYESYGNKNTYRYLNNYGFTLEENPYEEYMFVLNEQVADCLAYGTYIHESKLHLEGFAHKQADETFINDISNRKLTPYIFYVGYTFDSVRLMLHYLEQMYQEFKYEYIIRTCKRLSSMFPVGVEYDDALLSSSTNSSSTNSSSSVDLTFNELNCIRLRRGEKRIISFYEQYFTLVNSLYTSRKLDKKVIKKIRMLVNKHKHTDADAFMKYAENCFKKSDILDDERLLELSKSDSYTT
jgi:histone-lysine N-methyltransferase SETD3